jgi:hypothetical protein
VDLGSITAETFAPYTGQTFTLSLEGGNLALTLRTVEVLTASPPSPERRTPFALRFVGPEQPQLTQRIYPLDHPTLGTIALFLVPVGKDGGTIYEAVFA